MSEADNNNQSDEMLDSDDDLITAITPDVMSCLNRAKFFEKLDDRFCPEDTSRTRAKCGGNYDFSKPILDAAGFNADDLDDIFEVLRSQGGFCDCEILYNVAETSRLKAEYWRGRAAGDKKIMERHHP